MELMTNNLANYGAGLSHYAFGKMRLGGKWIVSDKEESRRTLFYLHVSMVTYTCKLTRDTVATTQHNTTQQVSVYLNIIFIENVLLLLCYFSKTNIVLLTPL